MEAGDGDKSRTVVYCTAVYCTARDLSRYDGPARHTTRVTRPTGHAEDRPEQNDGHGPLLPPVVRTGDVPPGRSWPHTGDRAVGPRALVSKNIIWLYRLGPR